jgi:hypothetical protein
VTLFSLPPTIRNPAFNGITSESPLSHIFTHDVHKKRHASLFHIIMFSHRTNLIYFVFAPLTVHNINCIVLRICLARRAKRKMRVHTKHNPIRLKPTL